MPSSALGEAFVLIGGDNSGLKKSVDESLAFVTRSVQSFSSISSAFSDKFEKSMSSAVSSIAGSGGITGTIAGLIDAFSGIERSVAAFDRAMVRAGETSIKTIRSIREGLGGSAGGTPFTQKQLLDAGTTALRTGARSSEVREIVELAIGATQLRGIGLAQATSQVAEAFRTGQGGALGISTQGNQTLEFNRDIIRNILGAAATTARQTTFQDPSLTGGAVTFARAVDAFNKILSDTGRRLFGGFSEEQRISAFSAELTKTTGAGPSARSRGLFDPKLLAGTEALAINAQEVADAFAFKQGAAKAGIFGDLEDVIERLIPSGKELADISDSLVDSFRSLSAIVSNIGPIADVFHETTAETTLSILDRLNIPRSVLGGGAEDRPGPRLRIEDFRFRDGGTEPIDVETLQQAVENGVRRGMELGAGRRPIIK